MSFQDQLKADMAKVFCNPAEFGEAITYRKRTGATRTIRACVNRGGVGPRGEVVVGVARVMRVEIPAGAAHSGIDPTEVDEGDALLIPWIIGGPPEIFMLPPAAAADAGALIFQFG